MCWLCYRVRPQDGPSELRIPDDFGCGYLVEKTLYTPREDGWKRDFTVFPPFSTEAFVAKELSSKEAQWYAICIQMADPSLWPRFVAYENNRLWFYIVLRGIWTSPYNGRNATEKYLVDGSVPIADWKGRLSAGEPVPIWRIPDFKISGANNSFVRAQGEVQEFGLALRGKLSEW
ncbi:MAG: hypothetical protein A2719_05270 [Candidatus Ryanbacteria bacterium RIFCSPHIGHO2_01_FULL_45_22]|uniref:Uncharacterized protein n=1 Tax=Candidatus Ryanbacteria bacterium RIFCSPHIGHO2_01_FULL_45_22 TaxID=1802114 RepID=A0A1G2G2E7_9BACT|nr:MAG: hypothetical protein A2719_05270 [Candidatus Ryanbacteria bacterium RIFCSPHIGHO2_01_FULL_45_22]